MNFKYNDFVAVHYCVQSMSNTNDCAVFEAIPYRFLYEYIGPLWKVQVNKVILMMITKQIRIELEKIKSLVVHIGSRFVNYKNLGLFQNGSCQADQLFLANTQITSSLL